MKGQNIMLFCVPSRKEIERSVEIDKQIEEKGNTIKITYEDKVLGLEAKKYFLKVEHVLECHFLDSTFIQDNIMS